MSTPLFKRHNFLGDVLNALYMRPPYRKPPYESPVKKTSSNKSGWSEAVLGRTVSIANRLGFISGERWYVDTEIDGVYAGKQTVVRCVLPEKEHWEPTRVVSVGQTRRHVKNPEWNVNFIAHAPEDMRLLLDIVDRIEKLAEERERRGFSQEAARLRGLVEQAVTEENND